MQPGCSQPKTGAGFRLLLTLSLYCVLVRHTGSSKGGYVTIHVTIFAMGLGLLTDAWIGAKLSASQWKGVAWPQRWESRFLWCPVTLPFLPHTRTRRKARRGLEDPPGLVLVPAAGGTKVPLLRLGVRAIDSPQTHLWISKAGLSFSVWNERAVPRRVQARRARRRADT